MPFKKAKVKHSAKPLLNSAGVQRVAQSFAEEMLLIQVQVARDRRNPGHVRDAAAEHVLNRAIGKPHQAVEVTRGADSIEGKSVADLKLAFLDKLARILGEQSPEPQLLEAESVEVEDNS